MDQVLVVTRVYIRPLKFALTVGCVLLASIASAQDNAATVTGLGSVAGCTWRRGRLSY